VEEWLSRAYGVGFRGFTLNPRILTPAPGSSLPPAPGATTGGPQTHPLEGCIRHEGLRFTPSHEVDEETVRSTTTFVQREGELLLIPPDWWHQTYHLSATVAVASQMLNQHVSRRVFGHILERAGVPQGPGVWADLAEGRLAWLPPEEQVREVLQAACGRHFGKEEGTRLGFGG